MADVKTLWPDLSRAQVIDVTRCTAEYVERVLARNAGVARIRRMQTTAAPRPSKGAARSREWEGTEPPRVPRRRARQP